MSNAVKPDPITAELAAFAAGLGFETIPAGVVEHVKRGILDGLGCCLTGAHLPWTRMLAETVLADGGAPQASILGTAEKAPVAGAVLVNATAGHAFELDDIHRESILHPNAVTVPVALNVAEHQGGVSGRDVISAVVAGYEIGTRVGAAAGTELLLCGFHPQGVVGSVAATATAGHILGLDAVEMQNALGIAGSLGAGLMASQEGAMVKRLHSGRAAEAGVRAAYLAAKGFTGISDMVEAPYGGFVSAFAGKDDASRAVRGLGTEWETPLTGIKPHATVTSIHAALDALGTIMSENDLTAGDIAAIHAGVSQPTFVHCAWAYTAQSVTAAQMNIYYGLAMIAFDGVAFVEQFDAARIGDPEALALIDKITADVDPEIEARGHAFRHMARVRVETTDGRTFEQTIEHRKGSPENPLSPEDVAAKFDALAVPVVGAESAAAIKTRIGVLENQTDVGELIGLLC